MEKTFSVICTMIYNASVEVKAESADEAIDKVRDMLDDNELYENETTMPHGGTNCGIEFNLGEVTVDDACQIDDGEEDDSDNCDSEEDDGDNCDSDDDDAVTLELSGGEEVIVKETWTCCDGCVDSHPSLTVCDKDSGTLLCELDGESLSYFDLDDDDDRARLAELIENEVYNH